MNRSKSPFALILMMLFTACSQAQSPIYKDATQAVEIRVEDLLSKMTLEEKVAQMAQKTLNKFELDENGLIGEQQLEKYFKGLSSGTVESPFMHVSQVSSISEEVDHYMRTKTRLGIPAIQIAEGLHGYLAFGTTVFPQAIALGSTWNTSLIKQMSAVVAKEASASGVDQALSPVFDVSRDPRWGRTEESYGEDPFLVAEMGMAFVNGLQGEPDVTKTHIPEGKLMATAKHFVAYSTPLGGINLGVVTMGPRELRDTHLYPVKKAIQEANIYSVMPSYNELNGIPLHANEKMLKGVLRDELGFKGYTFSDYQAVLMLETNQKVVANQDDAGLAAIQGGVDLEAPFAYGFENLADLVRAGKLDESLIDDAVRNILTAKFKAGLFERPYTAPTNLDKLIHTEEHIALARTIAEESIILLKNEHDLLPLDKNKLKSIAVIGPNADRMQYGDYSATKDKATGVTLLQGIQDIVGDDVEVNYAEGVHVSNLDASGIAAAVKAAEKSDMVVLAIGGTHLVLGGVGWEGEFSGVEADDKNINPPTGGEGYDRTNLLPPGLQTELIEAIYKTGKPIVLVMIHGRPYNITWENDNLPAIVEAWYAGEQGGHAIASVLFGDTNPSGKLTVSVPRNVGQIPVFYNHKPTHRGFYEVRGTKETPGRDYVFDTPDPLYPFGYGLSYTEFNYSDLKLDKNSYSVADEKIVVSLKVKNTGDREGKEVVQLYFNDLVSSVATPVKSLKGFEKIHLAKGESKNIEFELPIQEMGLWDKNMNYVVEAGDFEIMVAASAVDIRLSKTISIGAE